MQFVVLRCTVGEGGTEVIVFLPEYMRKHGSPHLWFGGEF